MNRLFLVAILLFSFVSAGNLRSGNEFVLEMIKAIGVDEVGCAIGLKTARDNGFVCASLPVSKDLSEIKNQWDGFAESASKKLGFVYASKTKWAFDSVLGDYKFYSLNNDVHVISLIRNSAFMDSIIFSSNAGYGAEPITAAASPSVNSLTPQSQQPQPTPQAPVQTPVAVAPSRAYDLEVTRYLCQPSSNGYARVFGTVRNTSNRTFKFLEFSVEFFNGSQFVAQESSYVKADDLAPNAETTFDTITKVGGYTRCTISFEDKAGKLNVKFP